MLPKGSDPAAPVVNLEPNATKDVESEIVIPEIESIPNMPSIEEYKLHNTTHYPFKAWCPICVKNAAKNKPHHKVMNQIETEVFSLD